MLLAKKFRGRVDPFCGRLTVTNIAPAVAIDGVTLATVDASVVIDVKCINK